VWAFTLALLTCLGIDFSNPLLPGVVRFGEEGSMHALRAERRRTDERPAPDVPRPLEPARVVHVAMTVPRLMAGHLDRPLLVQAVGRPRASIAAAPSGATTAVEDH
jgi:hypothetical protein